MEQEPVLDASGELLEVQRELQRSEPIFRWTKSGATRAQFDDMTPSPTRCIRVNASRDAVAPNNRRLEGPVSRGDDGRDP